MKKMFMIALVVVMITGIWSGSASAANSLQQGAYGISVGVNEDFIISGRYLITQDLAALAGLGFGFNGSDASGTDFGISAGIRKYLKVDDLAPFVGAEIFYSSKYAISANAKEKDLGLFALFGAEYFLHKQFSVEGTVGIGYLSQELGSTKVTNFGTRRAGISFNFYF
jgi:hypothetical protein